MFPAAKSLIPSVDDHSKHNGMCIENCKISVYVHLCMYLCMLTDGCMEVQMD